MIFIGSFAGFICCCLFCIAARAQRTLLKNENHLQANNIEQYGSNDPLPFISSDTSSYQQMELASITPMTTNSDDQKSELNSDELKASVISWKYEAL